MDDKYKRLIKEERERFDIINNEPYFEASSFVEELVFMLGDYFVGNFILRDGSIICAFANGQIIKLTATEVKNVE